MIGEVQVRTGSSRPGAATIDTRITGSPDSRVYAASFARIWDALHDEISRRRRWVVIHSDEDLGLLTAVCGTLLPWEIGHLSVWVRLDEYGLTRVDVRSTSRSTLALPGGNRRRVQAIISSLDNQLGPGARVRT
jgi:hypothetical protein